MFKLSVLPPSQNSTCVAFQERKGTFAVLGRCAKCNKLRSDHPGYVPDKVATPSPAIKKTTTPRKEEEDKKAVDTWWREAVYESLHATVFGDASIEDGFAEDNDVVDHDSSVCNSDEEKEEEEEESVDGMKRRRASSDFSARFSFRSVDNKRVSLQEMAKQIRTKMRKASKTWESKIGDSLPKCNRCGLPIEGKHKLISAGMERFHEICPKKEESEKGDRDCRHLVQKAQDRLVMQLKCTTTSTVSQEMDTYQRQQVFTFIYDLDTSSKMKCLRKRNNENMVLLYKPDVQQHAGLDRRLNSALDLKSASLDVSVRYEKPFTFLNPETGKEEPFPQEAADFDQHRVFGLEKFCTQNGVRHRLNAHFQLSESHLTITPQNLEIHFSMDPENSLNAFANALPRKPTIVKAPQDQNVLLRLASSKGNEDFGRLVHFEEETKEEEEEGRELENLPQPVASM